MTREEHRKNHSCKHMRVTCLLCRSLPVAGLMTVWCLAPHIRKATGDFTVAQICSNFPHVESWQTQSITDSTVAERVLRQPFTYLGHGGQSWAFLSADRNYVLKFFKFRLTWADIFQCLPAPLSYCLPGLTQKQHHRLQQKLGGYALAMTRFQERSLLVATYLNGKADGIRMMHIIDRLGIDHLIDLGNKPFVLQRCAVPLTEVIAQSVQEGNISLVNQKLIDCLALIADLCAAGLRDEDKTLYRNVGFLDGHAVYIDAGSLIDAPEMYNPQRTEEECARAGTHLSYQLQKYFGKNIQNVFTKKI